MATYFTKRCWLHFPHRGEGTYATDLIIMISHSHPQKVLVHTWEFDLFIYMLANRHQSCHNEPSKRHDSNQRHNTSLQVSLRFACPPNFISDLTSPPYIFLTLLNFGLLSLLDRVAPVAGVSASWLSMDSTVLSVCLTYQLPCFHTFQQIDWKPSHTSLEGGS